ncbi:hypothetical protein T11_6445 [Trichinella zimbabwensis]|uniref:Uncharacterized protein n=1 Tax=Trichinella zimbabwensis TaxID=268475 RepID=A0A0V1H1U4_9BILA|nr:hypothetical protein T11_6445 [Trichinella zimbabwensis]
MSTIALLIMGKSCKRYSFVRLIIRTTIKNLKPVRIEVLESFVFGRNCELSILIDASKLQAKRHFVSTKRLMADLISNR